LKKNLDFFMILCLYHTLKAGYSNKF